MSPLAVWFLFYLLPIGIAGSFAKLFPTKGNEPVGRDAFIVHAALIVSIIGSQYALYTSGVVFPWSASDPFILLYGASVFVAILTIGTLGLWYGLSAFLQQATMLSMAFVLYPAYPLWAIVLFIVPIYAAAHLLKVRYAGSRMTLFFVWGTVAVVSFAFIPSVWLFVAIHTLVGALLIRWGVLYPRSKISKGFV